MVTGIEEGFLRFRTLGGVDPRMLPDRELTILTQPPIFGVVACLPPHVLKPGDSKKSIPIPELMVDIGMSQEQAEQAVPIGTPMVFRGGCTLLGDKLMCGKAMDDRSCFVTLLRAAELLGEAPLDVDLYIVGSVCEEFTAVGAKTAVFAIRPDWCVAVDVTHGATPDGPHLPPGRRAGDWGGAQYDHLDDQADDRQGGGTEAGISAGGHGGTHRHQRLAYAN